ncbi:hypothetical protein SAMN05443247_08808, partial [Bradyrhizobium erythrophlei]
NIDNPAPATDALHAAAVFDQGGSMLDAGVTNDSSQAPLIGAAPAEDAEGTIDYVDHNGTEVSELAGQSSKTDMVLDAPSSGASIEAATIGGYEP